MKRRILSLALALLLALACAAVPAAAAGIDDYPIFYSNVNGSRVMDLNSHPDADGYFPDFDVPGSDLYLQSIRTYHWNSGRGASPGLISIYDWDTDICYGEWAATGTDGNTWWVVYPDMPLEGGRHYYIKTTDNHSWSFNSESNYHCFAEVRGYTTGGTIPGNGGNGNGGSNLPPSRQTAAVEVMVNGSYVTWTDAWPFIDENNRTMVPLRAVADAMGLTVGWDGKAREASFTDGSRAIYFPIGSRTARTGGGGQVQMDTAAVIVNDRTYAPIRYLAEYFGFSVGWDGTTRTVLITGSSTPGGNSGGAGDYSFAAQGIDANVDNHGQKTYRTVAENGGIVNCSAWVSSYRVFESDDAMPYFDGYEWRVMTIGVTVPENAGQSYVISSNYYDMKGHEDSEWQDDDGVFHYSVNWQGRSADYTYWWRQEHTGDDYRLTFTAQVPKGYDGLVVGLANAAVIDGADDGNYLFQNYTGAYDFALFRMK